MVWYAGNNFVASRQPAGNQQAEIITEAWSGQANNKQSIQTLFSSGTKIQKLAKKTKQTMPNAA